MIALQDLGGRIENGFDQMGAIQFAADLRQIRADVFALYPPVRCRLGLQLGYLSVKPCELCDHGVGAETRAGGLKDVGPEFATHLKVQMVNMDGVQRRAEAGGWPLSALFGRVVLCCGRDTLREVRW